MVTMRIKHTLKVCSVFEKGRRPLVGSDFLLFAVMKLMVSSVTIWNAVLYFHVTEGNGGYAYYGFSICASLPGSGSAANLQFRLEWRVRCSHAQSQEVMVVSLLFHHIRRSREGALKEFR